MASAHMPAEGGWHFPEALHAPVNRRQAIALGIGGVATGIAAGIYSLTSNSKTEAERMIEAFPTQLRGAARIGKYFVPGAKHSMVYFLLDHANEREPGNPLSIDQRDVDHQADCMEDIALSLDHLAREHPELLPRNVLMEALEAGPDEAFQSMYRWRLVQQEQIARLDGIILAHRRSPTSSSQREIERAENEIARLRTQNSAQRYERYYGAIGDTAGNLGLSLRGAEDRANLDRINDILGEMMRGNNSRSSEFMRLQRERERLHLSAVVRSPGHDTLVMGCMHSTTLPDSISRWNTENPQDKIGYVAIMPNAVQRRLDSERRRQAGPQTALNR